uniref:Uncharacterized protein n=1 Tax=Biomphalaria glabrata TaxID=6526 RepID=A0A2C9JC88_BIOGL
MDEIGEIDFDLSEWMVLDDGEDDNETNNAMLNSTETEKDSTSILASPSSETNVKNSEAKKADSKLQSSDTNVSSVSTTQKSSPKPAKGVTVQPKKATISKNSTTVLVSPLSDTAIKNSESEKDIKLQSSDTNLASVSIKQKSSPRPANSVTTQPKKATISKTSTPVSANQLSDTVVKNSEAKKDDGQLQSSDSKLASVSTTQKSSPRPANSVTTQPKEATISKESTEVLANQLSDTVVKNSEAKKEDSKLQSSDSNPASVSTTQKSSQRPAGSVTTQPKNATVLPKTTIPIGKDGKDSCQVTEKVQAIVTQPKPPTAKSIKSPKVQTRPNTTSSSNLNKAAVSIASMPSINVKEVTSISESGTYKKGEIKTPQKANAVKATTDLETDKKGSGMKSLTVTLQKCDSKNTKTQKASSSPVKVPPLDTAGDKEGSAKNSPGVSKKDVSEEPKPKTITSESKTNLKSDLSVSASTTNTSVKMDAITQTNTKTVHTNFTSSNSSNSSTKTTNATNMTSSPSAVGLTSSSSSEAPKKTTEISKLVKGVVGSSNLLGSNQSNKQPDNTTPKSPKINSPQSTSLKQTPKAENTVMKKIQPKLTESSSKTMGSVDVGDKINKPSPQAPGKSSAQSNTANIDSKSLAAVMLSVEKKNAQATNETLDAGTKSEVFGTKQEMPRSDSEPVRKKTKLEEQTSDGAVEKNEHPQDCKQGSHTQSPAQSNTMKIDSTSIAAAMVSVEKKNSPVTYQTLEAGRKSDVLGIKREMAKSEAEPVRKIAKLEEQASDGTKDKKDENAPEFKQASVNQSANLAGPQSKASAKRIVHRFHRATQTVSQQLDKPVQCSLMCQPQLVGVCVQAGSPNKPSWQDEVRFIRTLPDSVYPSIFKMVSEFNITKVAVQNIHSEITSYKFGIRMGRLAAAHVMKDPFKENIVFKADYFKTYFEGLETGVVDLHVNDQENLLNIISQFRKTTIGPRHLVVTISMRLDEDERDPLCPLNDVKCTIVFDRFFATSTFYREGKDPAWMRPKAVESVSFHNVPGGIPLSFLKILVPEAITIQLTPDKDNKFTKSGRRIIMNFAKKAGEHFLQLFSQIYINNECVIATLGLTQPKQVPELADIEKAKANWLVEMEQFPDPCVCVRDDAPVTRDVAEKQSSMAQRKEPIEVFASRRETSPDAVERSSDVGGDLEKAFSNVSADLSDISDTSDMDGPTQKTTKVALKKSSTKKQLDSLRSTLKSLSKPSVEKSKKQQASHKVLKGAKTLKSSTALKSRREGTSRLQRDSTKLNATRPHRSFERGQERSPREKLDVSHRLNRSIEPIRRQNSNRLMGKDVGSQDRVRQIRGQREKVDKLKTPESERRSRIDSVKPRYSRDHSEHRSQTSYITGNARAVEREERRKDRSLSTERQRRAWSRSPVRQARRVRSKSPVRQTERVWTKSPVRHVNRVWSKSPVRKVGRGRSASPRRRSPASHLQYGRLPSPVHNLRRVIIRKSLSPFRRSQDQQFVRRGEEISKSRLPAASTPREYGKQNLSPISAGDDMDMAEPEGGVWLQHAPGHSEVSRSQNIQILSGRMTRETDLRKPMSGASIMKNLVTESADNVQKDRAQENRELLTKIMEQMKTVSNVQFGDPNLTKAIEVSAQILETIKNARPAPKATSNESRALPDSGMKSSDTSSQGVKKLEPFQGYVGEGTRGSQSSRPSENLLGFGHSNLINRFPGQSHQQQRPLHPGIMSNSNIRLPPPIPPPVVPPMFNNNTMFSSQDRLSQMEALAQQLASDIQKHQQQPLMGGQPRWNQPQQPSNPNPMQVMGPSMQGPNVNSMLNIMSQRLGAPQMNQQQPMAPPNNMRGMNQQWPSNNFF